MKRKSLIVLLILVIVSAGIITLKHVDYIKEKNELENKNSEKKEGNKSIPENRLRRYCEKTKELTLSDFDFLKQGMSKEEIIETIKQPFSIGGHETNETNFSQMNYDLIDGQIRLYFGLDNTLWWYSYKTDEELGRQGMRKNLRLDDFDFLKKGMTITEVEEFVGTRHGYTGKDYKRDVYFVENKLSYIALDYGPERDALRYAKVINRKNDVVKDFPLKQ